MGNDLLFDSKIIRVSNAVAAGTSDVNCTAVDMSDCEGVLFLAAFGTLTANQVTQIYAQEDDVVGMGNAANLTGTIVGPLADNASNKCLALAIHRPLKQFCRCVVDRGTANAVIDAVFAIKYGMKWKPAAADATLYAAETHVYEIAGTP